MRGTSWIVVQFFRNAPWLVLLFFVMFLMPFEFRVAGVTIPFPDWIKATLGLALPIMANVAEIVRGAVQSIPTAQWEAARSLAFSRRQTLWKIILPQCVKRMLPPWMNWYAILTMATTLASIVGVSEVMTITAADHQCRRPHRPADPDLQLRAAVRSSSTATRSRAGRAGSKPATRSADEPLDAFLREHGIAPRGTSTRR